MDAPVGGDVAHFLAVGEPAVFLERTLDQEHLTLVAGGVQQAGIAALLSRDSLAAQGAGHLAGSQVIGTLLVVGVLAQVAGGFLLGLGVGVQRFPWQS